MPKKPKTGKQKMKVLKQLDFIDFIKIVSHHGLDRSDLLYTSKDRKIPGPARNDREVPGTTRRHRDIPEITGKQASRCDRFLIFYDHLSNRKYSREEGDLSILKKHFHKT